MASQRMLDFLLNLPSSVYSFDADTSNRRLLYTQKLDDSSSLSYSVVSSPAHHSSHGVPVVLVSFICPSMLSSNGLVSPEVFSIQIAQRLWGKRPPEDWLAAIIDAAQRSAYGYELQ